jgi:hypothetical protein
MYLLLGQPDDPCCAGVCARLERRGLPARIVSNPLAPPARLTWRLDAAGVTSSLYPGVSDESIAGVLVRDTGWLEPDGWDVADYAYVQTELRAVTLAWLAGLPCTVINRPDAARWYRAGAPLLTWRPLLVRAGLRLPDVVITNDVDEGVAFRHDLASSGIGGAIYSPVTETSGYVLADDDAWERVALVQARAPVCLSEPHGAATIACVVGNDVIWNGAVAAEAVALEPALSRFAAAARLDFVEIAVAPVRRGLAVVLVEPQPRFEHFTEPARTRILDALVSMLTHQQPVASNAAVAS